MTLGGWKRPPLPSPGHTLTWRDTQASSGSGGKAMGGSFSSQQNRAIFIAALSCASFGLILVLVTLRWFLIMRRGFRHRLILHLIISDTMKAIWYFVFPIVVLAHGPIAGTSKFCQASGFLLAFAIEASDMAIFMIALHCTLSILRPHNNIGEGGLYRCGNWIYLMWLGPPVVAASVAFVNNTDGYTTAGTFCYLPKRPFWYRLALAWVPRYVVISLILVMYIWIYIYVRVKFRGFDNLGVVGSSYESAESRQKSALSTKTNDPERRPTDHSHYSTRSEPPLFSHWQPQYQTSQTETPQPAVEIQPWDQMKFITSRALQSSVPLSASGEGTMEARGSDWSGNTRAPSVDASAQLSAEASKLEGQRSSEERPTIASGQRTPGGTSSFRIKRARKQPAGTNDALRKTRMAIRKQLRYLFVYPLVYIIVWSFPFASHALSYNDYYVQHPIFWLSLTQTIMLSLQAGIDSIMFSCSEKPWRRVAPSSKFSIPFLRRQSKGLLQRLSLNPPPVPKIETSARQDSSHNPTWWEAEGRRRNDSVWLGTNTNLSSVASRMRSASPQKRKTSLHFRTRSKEQGAPFVPKLDSIAPEPVSPLGGTESRPASSSAVVGQIEDGQAHRS